MKSRTKQRAFSLVEVMIAAMLSAGLLVMVSGIWMGLGRAAAENIADSQMAGDAQLAMETLRRDLSGHLPGATSGRAEQGRLVGRLIVGGDQLKLCYDGGAANGAADWSSPDVVVDYDVDGSNLVRFDDTTGTAFVAATGVEQFLVSDLGSGVRIELTLRRRNNSRTYTFISRDP